MLKLNHKLALTLFFVLISFFCFSQRDNTYTIDASAILGTEQTPFWMRANKFGKVPTKGQTAAVFLGTNSDYQNTENKIDWGYGLNIGGFAGMENKFIIQQAYIKAKWRAFELYAGRREEIQGLVDTTLSSGSYIWSGNALPMPKIDMGIRDYISIGGEGLISIKGNYAHGWFDSGRADASGVFLHQKSFYARIGKPNYKLNFYGGFNHQAQWGGTAKISSSRKYESSIKDYLEIIMGKSNVGEDTTGLDPNSAGNRTGNHLGTLDLGLEFEFLNSKIFLYRQNIFEDGSLYYLNNISDGLNGISISLKQKQSEKVNIKKITFEFLNTLSQGGIIGSNALEASKRGQDQYFNNAQYSDGWSYNRTSIGTPYILTKNEFPQTYKKVNEYFFTNNRSQVYYLGLCGDIFNDFKFNARYSFSKNWGNYTVLNPQIKSQNSFYFRIDKEIKKIFNGSNIYMTIAGDAGDLMDSNLAVQFGIKKTWGSLPIISHPTHKH